MPTNQAPAEAHGDALALAHRIAWRYKKSSDPAHSDTYTFNEATLLQFVAAVQAAHVQPKGTEPVYRRRTDAEALDCANRLNRSFPPSNLKDEAADHIRELVAVVQAPAPAQRYAADLADTIQQVANAIGYAGQDPEVLIAEVKALAAQSSAVGAEPTDIDDGWRKEVDDTDALLRYLGLDPEQCRTDGGWLNLPRIRSLMDEQDDEQDAARYRHWRDNAEVICAILRYESPVWIDAYLAQALAERDAAHPPVQGSQA